jgi:hypothetical protein
MASPNNQSSQIIELQPIPSVSPSLSETLRKCPLQAAFSRLPELNKFVIGNPKAWLGIAYHEVMEKIWAPIEIELTGDELVEHLWSKSIQALKQKKLDHPLNCRFSVHEKWPGYYLTRACVQMRAQQVLAERPLGLARPETSTVRSNIFREQYLTALDGKLVGKPDIIMENEIRDYKSGKVYVETDEGATVKEEYVRQLYLYGHLVHASSGKCPEKGQLLPMQGENIEIDLDPSLCAAEAARAVSLLDSYNSRLANASDVLDIATPSPSACRWCQFKLVCPAFWKAAKDGWIEEIANGAVRGMLDKSLEFIHDDKAIAVSLNVHDGTISTSPITIAPLDRNIHANISGCKIGDEIRIINLGIRRNLRPYPSISTVCLRDDQCPSFKIPGSN